MNGWSGSIACCQLISLLPPLQAVVSMAQALIPLGNAPCRPSTVRSLIWPRSRSIAPSAFACAEETVPALHSAERLRKNAKAEGRGILLRLEGSVGHAI